MRLRKTNLMTFIGLGAGILKHSKHAEPPNKILGLYADLLLWHIELRF